MDSSVFFDLYKQLLPTGRAWNLYKGSNLDYLFSCLSENDLKKYDLVEKIKKVSLPYTITTIEEVKIWEQRFGIISNSSLSVEERKLEIIRKYDYPSNFLERQGLYFMETEIRKAGYNVYLKDNIFYDNGGNLYTKDPNALTSTGNMLDKYSLGEYVLDSGSLDYTLLANNIDEQKDASYVFSSNFEEIIFVGNISVKDNNSTDLHAIVNKKRKKEFRELLFKLKPTHSVCVLYINYL